MTGITSALLGRSRKALSKIVSRGHKHDTTTLDFEQACLEADELLFNGKGENDRAKATELLLEAAEMNHPVAQGRIAFCYEFGLGIETDFKKAEAYYIKASEAEDGLGMARLAFLRKYGRPSVKIDRAEAESWQERVNEQGPEAIAWLQTAADKYKNAAAQYCLGVCYHDGVGVDKDEMRAVYWYRQSALQGHPRGQGILGYCYGEGFGVPKDEKEAMRWYRLAAEQGESVAIYNVGYCYEDGIGVEKDPKEAVKVTPAHFSLIPSI
jgi:TPR repeat protein